MAQLNEPTLARRTPRRAGDDRVGGQHLLRDVVAVLRGERQIPGAAAHAEGVEQVSRSVHSNGWAAVVAPTALGSIGMVSMYRTVQRDLSEILSLFDLQDAGDGGFLGRNPITPA